MPTGYTEKIRDGISFKEFALNCSRAFGALIHMRDDPMDKEIPKSIIVSDYDLVMSQKIKRELEELLNLPRSEIQKRIDAEYDSAEKRRIESLKKDTDLKNKYEIMLKQAIEWTPPTPDHAELKKFMIEQIQQSIRCDCSVEYLEIQTSKMSVEEWRAESIERLKSRIKHHEEEYAKECKRAEEKTAWIQALKGSL
ncbi:MAG: hypothetical protein V4629_02935 [Pseudomonadota bacterium]